MKFRYDINALRAVAVILVMLFHFEISGFNGGFIGVDIFFVISGYLMTRIIIDGLRDNNFSIWRFYLARTKRIIPALAVLCCALLAFGWFWLAPSEYAVTAQHSASSLGFFSNFVYKDEAGYFDTLSKHKWLLHTWSLSVEWQFYLLYPLLLLGIAKATKSSEKAFRYTLIILGLISVIGSVIVSPLKPDFAFFILPTRIWQMVAGGLVYLYGAQLLNLSPLKKRNLSFLGLGIIVLSGVIFHSDYFWPGYAALLPIAGAVIFLLASQQEAFWVKNTLTQRLGDWSYSIYLWHWPVFVGFSYFSFQFFGWQAAGIALSIFLGFLSYTLVEQPTRKMAFKRLHIFTLIGIVGAIAGISVFIDKQDGVGFRVSEQIRIADNESKNIPPQPNPDQCTPYPSRPGRNICTYGDVNDPQVVLWGDSHGGTMMTALHQALGGGVISHFNQCPIIMNARMKGKSRKKNCPEFQQDIRHLIENAPEDLPLVVVARFVSQLHGPNESKSKIYGLVYDDLSDTEKNMTNVELFQKRLTETLCYASQFRTVYVVEPVPEMKRDIPRLIVNQLMTGQNPHAGISYSEYVKRIEDVMPALNQAASQCGVRLLPTSDYLCPDKQTCIAADKSGRPYYYDDDHLSEYGNKLLVPMFEKIVR